MPHNPLGWVQAQVAGGWKRTWIIGVCYLLGALTLGTLSYRGAVTGRSGLTLRDLCSIGLVLLTSIQAGMFLLMWPGGTRKAVLRDYTSGMIDQHRLTPMSGAWAAIGYLTGPNIQIVALTLANLLLAVCLCIAGGFPLAAVVFGMMLMLTTGLMIATLLLLISMSSRAGHQALVVLLLILLPFGIGIVFLIPGIGLLTGFYTGVSIVRAANAAVTPSADIMYTWIAQITLAGILFVAAARKYLRDDVLAFPWPWALVLLAFACAAGGLGIRMWPDYLPQFMRWDMSDVPSGIQWLFTLLTCILLSLLPVLSAARAEAAWAQRRQIDPLAPQRPPWSFAVVAPITVCVGLAALVAACGAQLSGITSFDSRAGELRPISARDLLTTAIAWLATLLPPAVLARWVYQHRDRVRWFLTGLILLTWLGPLLLDGARMLATDSDGPSSLMLLSPLGMTYHIWTGSAERVWIGIAAHVILAAVLAILGWRSIRALPANLPTARAASQE